MYLLLHDSPRNTFILNVTTTTFSFASLLLFSVQPQLAPSHPPQLCTMAELGVIGLMISSTATAGGLLGLIKRRCGALESIASLINKCDKSRSRIHTLLRTLEGDAKLPNDTRSIATALNLRNEELKAIEIELSKIDRRSKRASKSSRIEFATMAQGWEKKLNGVYGDLKEVRNGIESLVVSWESRRAIMEKVDDIVTIDVTRGASSSGGVAMMMSDDESVSGSVTGVDRMLSTGLKLNVADWNALAKYGRLDKNCLPDALNEASQTLFVQWNDNFEKRMQYEKHSLRLRHLAADLQHPGANYKLGRRYEVGAGVQPDAELSISHYKVACAAGYTDAMCRVADLYASLGCTEQSMKYMHMAADLGYERAIAKLVIRHFQVDGGAEEARKWLERSENELLLSFCYVNGFVVEKCEQKALKAVSSIEDSSTDIYVHCEPDIDQQFSMNISLHGRDNNKNLWSYFDLLLRDRNRRWLEFLINSGLHSIALWHADYLDVRNRKHLFRLSAKNDNLAGHIWLVYFYSSGEHRNLRRVQQHLRIAAKCGSSSAQNVCRKLYGSTERASHGVKSDENEDEKKKCAKRSLSKRKERLDNQQESGKISSRRAQPFSVQETILLSFRTL